MGSSGNRAHAFIHECVEAAASDFERNYAATQDHDNKLRRVCCGVASGHSASITEVKGLQACIVTGYISDCWLPVLPGWVSSLKRDRLTGLIPVSDIVEIEPFLLADLLQVCKLFWKLEKDLKKDDPSSFHRRLRESGRIRANAQVSISLQPILTRWLGECPQSGELQGKHGPGAVSTGESGADKWLGLAGVPCGIDPMAIRCNSRHLSDDYPLEYRYGLTKVIQVPKDVRGNRFISCEPLEYQFLQQSIRPILEARIKAATRGKASFNDQDTHRDKLRSGRYASIDLSDASDYVSRRLVANAFPSEWRDLLFRTRSTFAVDEGSVIPLRTFAPMGSALCFSVMTTVICAILHDAGCKAYSVFGDDILVLKRDFERALGALEMFGLKPNLSKCCKGVYRESCGLDIYVCQDNIYVREPLWIRQCPDDYVSSAQLAMRSRAFLALGFSNVASVLSSLFKLPADIRFNEEYQRLEEKTLVIQQRPRKQALNGYEALLRYFNETPEASCVLSRNQLSRPRISHAWLPSLLLASP